MGLKICSLASGSSGNCYMIKSEETLLLIDAGISGKQIRERLSGICLNAESIDGVLITHEHIDHIRGLSALTKLNTKIYVSSKTLDAIEIELDEENCTSFCPGEKFEIGDITIESFSTSHDAADPVGYCLSSGGSCVCIVTDTGYVAEEIVPFMAKADILVLESNHDENVLKVGPYPWFLKQRILSDKGHLSNEAAATALAELIASEDSQKKRLVLLAHLSKENNFPEMAKATMENVLREKGCKPNACKICVLSRNEVSEIYG